nr:unnamed protein product [Spirometra erinaceieuropaei]
MNHIRTSYPPVFARPRRLAPGRFQAAKAEFEHMLQLGIIRPSESPGGGYRTLNSAIIPDRRHEDIPKTVVTTPFGLFDFIRIPFGLRNVAQTFQRSIDHVLRGLPFVYAYINDLLVASRNEEEHKEHLALVFDRLDKFGVVINPSKCVLGVPPLEFLDHPVDSEGLRPLPSKDEAVRNFPPPNSKRQLQRFLSMVNFYRRFLPNCADLILPLTNMLSGPKGPLEQIGDALTTFERIKNFVADATLLTHPAPEAQLSLTVDALTVAVGAVLQKHLAVQSEEDRHLEYISQFTINIRHIDGAKNEVADMLSRPSLSSLQPSHGIDLCAMAAEQQRVGCPGDESVSGLQLKDVPLTTGSGTILCDVSTPFHRPFVPASMRRAVFQTLHGLSHPGIRASQKLFAKAANGMVERLHRQLKTALRAVEDPENRSDNFPLALLGIRAALKSDLGCSAAELVLATTLRMPGEMITPTSRGADEIPDNFVHRLRQFMRSPSPIPPRTPTTESYVKKDLDNCTRVRPV